MIRRLLDAWCGRRCGAAVAIRYGSTPCGHVALEFLRGSGRVVVGALLDPDDARRLAANLDRFADDAELGGDGGGQEAAPLPPPERRAT